MKDLDNLRELLGMDVVYEEVEYPLPRPEQTSLDSDKNLQKYALAHMVLETPEINEVLAEMDAFSTLNRYEVDSYYNMASSVINALRIHHEENDGTPEDYQFEKPFPISEDVVELDEFGEEFLIEFSKNRFSLPSKDKDGDEDNVDADSFNKRQMEVPPQANNWFQKMASKFGFNDLSLKDFIYLYFINQYSNKGGAESSNIPMRENYQALLNEKAPPGMEGWIKSRKAAFKKEYGDEWERVLYGAAWKAYKEGKVNESFEDDSISYTEMQNRLGKAGWDEDGGIALWSHPDYDFWLDGNSAAGLLVYPVDPKKGPFAGSSDSFITAFNNLDDFFNWVDKRNVTESVDDVYGGADSPKHVEKVENRKGPKLTSKVKSDVAQRIKELNDLIDSYEEKKHYYGDVKPAVFNAKDSLEFIMDKCKSGDLCDYKEAQLHFQKVMSPIANLFPPSLVKFLAYGSDGEDVTKEV